MFIGYTGPEVLDIFDDLLKHNILNKHRIWAILCHKVDMGNIYFCSDAYISCSKMDNIE